MYKISRHGYLQNFMQVGREECMSRGRIDSVSRGERRRAGVRVSVCRMKQVKKSRRERHVDIVIHLHPLP